MHRVDEMLSNELTDNPFSFHAQIAKFVHVFIKPAHFNWLPIGKISAIRIVGHFYMTVPHIQSSLNMYNVLHSRIKVRKPDTILSEWYIFFFRS